MLLLYIEQFDDERDKRLFAAMYERYERKLYAVALSILQVPAQAEDAVHDAFLKVIKHFDRAKEIPRQKIEGWLVIIVKNTALDMLRKARNSTSIEELWDVPSDVTPEGESEYNRLVAVIRSMPENYRAILEMKYVLEYSNAEIARAMGISENAVAARLYRCRDQLKKRLRQEGFVYE